jgi:alpha-L-fucosidase
MSVNSEIAAPSDAQAAWMRLGYGMFIHFGPNTLAGVGWGDGRFPAARFEFSKLDARQWAAVAAEAGMRYAVLTAKHHDGFCLWPSADTEYSVKSSPGRRDVIGEFVRACRGAGILPGIYYSLWDRNWPFYEDDAAYCEYMQRQISELLTDYGPLVEIWFDGGWDKEYPTRQWAYDPAWPSDPQVDQSALRGGRWKWRELYDLVHRLQPDCLVTSNSGSDRPGAVRYHPIDFRRAEHFDFVYQGRICKPIVDSVFTDSGGKPIFLPLEFCTSLNPNWFYVGDKFYSHPSAAAIAGWHRAARGAGANLLLNVGPDTDGLIPEYHARYLREARKLF